MEEKNQVVANDNQPVSPNIMSPTPDTKNSPIKNFFSRYNRNVIVNPEDAEYAI